MALKRLLETLGANWAIWVSARTPHEGILAPNDLTALPPDVYVDANAVFYRDFVAICRRHYVYAQHDESVINIHQHFMQAVRDSVNSLGCKPQLVWDPGSGVVTQAKAAEQARRRHLRAKAAEHARRQLQLSRDRHRRRANFARARCRLEALVPFPPPLLLQQLGSIAEDECDTCIQRMTRSSDTPATKVVVSTDTDFVFCEPSSSYGYVLFRRPKGDHVVLNKGKLEDLPSWPWKDASAMRQVALIAGQDMTGVGIPSFGLLTMAKTQVIKVCTTPHF